MTNTYRKGRTQSNVGRAVRVSASEDIPQLLEMAFGLHQAGELGRARGFYERIIEQEPGHGDALHFLGLACFQDGEGERAVELIRRAIEQNPRVAPYHDNLGAVLESRGALEEALEAYREAGRLGGEDAERTFNIGVVLARLGRYREAEQAYRDAIARAPGDGGFHYNLANLLKDQDRLGEAVDHYRQAIDREPGSADARNNLGNALQALGRREEAVDAYEGAIGVRPEDATTHVNLANVHRELANLDAAATAYERAVSLEPTRHDARRALGETQRALGRFDAALLTYEALLDREPRDGAALVGLASVLRFLPVESHRPALCQHILRCFEAPEVQAQDLAAAAAAQLRSRYGLDADGLDMAGLLPRLGDDPLMLALLTRTINIDARLERFLTAARAHLLLAGEAACESPATLRLTAAIAAQCFINEFVFPLSADQRQAAGRLRERVEQDLGAGGAPDDGLRARCALLAMIEPLLDVEGGESLARWERDAWGEPLWFLIERTVCEPLVERALQGELDTLGAIEDRTSRAVREQYEEHPYPRWLELPRREPVSYRDYLGNRFPHFAPPAFLDQPLQVLAAGCGTGQEAVAIAAGRSGCQVLGLDLSARSLAYARRMATKLGVESVDFVQGDILDVGSLDRRFHVVESTGVLHHMADPIAGWRALRDCMEPGGLMRVGLYSEHARADVMAAREQIRTRSLEPVEADIRELREQILSSPAGAPLAGLADSEDLYTMSSCRDLLFHVEEHRFTIPDIASALDELGLQFIGFDSVLPGALQEYRAANPDDVHMNDLSRWQRFEESHPDLFAALYVFWCQKRP